MLGTRDSSSYRRSRNTSGAPDLNFSSSLFCVRTSGGPSVRVRPRPRDVRGPVLPTVLSVEKNSGPEGYMYTMTHVKHFTQYVDSTKETGILFK